MSFLQALVLILVCFCLEFCICRDTISSTQSITDPETLVSNGTIFKLGFFSPDNTTHRYLGMLYNIYTTTAVWVANRDKPLNDSLGTVTISDDGNLIVLDGRNDIIWSTNVSNSMANSNAQLLDTGNLVLRDNSNGRTLWESFENPTDSFLERMRISTSINRDENNFMTSWKSPSDPSIGSFSAGIDPLSVPEIFIWNDSKPYWRSGPWNGQVFIGIPSMNSVYINGFNLVHDREGSVSLSYKYANESVVIYIALNSEGNLLEKYWYEGKEDWEITWMALENVCDVYGKCGPFGSCYSKDSPICSCLKGFEPNNMEEWSSGNWTSGCARRTQLQCDRNSSTGKEDGFLKLTAMKVPDFSLLSNVEEDNCGSQCLSNCSCIAYSYYSGIGCTQWNGTLIDTQQFSDGHRVDLYIRVAYSYLEKKTSMKVVIAITVIIWSIAIAICSYLSWKCIAKRKGRKLESELSLSTGGEIYKGYSYENTARDTVKQVKLEELPLFTFETLTNATGNFPSANKLGQGGFGSVYKGNCQMTRNSCEKAFKILWTRTGGVYERGCGDF